MLQVNKCRRLGAVAVAQVAVGLHQESAAVAVTEPVGNGRDRNARLDGQGRKVVPQVVLTERGDTQPLAGSLERLEAVLAAQKRPADTLGEDFIQQGAEWGVDRHLPETGVGLRAAHDYECAAHILDAGGGGFSGPEPGVGQEAGKLSRVLGLFYLVCFQTLFDVLDV